MGFITLPGSNMCAFEMAVAFGNKPGDTSPTWTDVSPYVRTVQTRRGRTRELDSFSTGTMAVTLNNSDRRFDPTYTSTPYGTTNLVPMVPIRLRAQYSAVTYDVWYGYVTGWPQAYDKGNSYAESTLSCVDGFEMIAATILPNSLYEMAAGAQKPIHWWKLDEAVGAAEAADTGSTVSRTALPHTGGVTTGNTALLSYDNSRTSTLYNGSSGESVARGINFPTGAFSIGVWFQAGTVTANAINYVPMVTLGFDTGAGAIAIGLGSIAPHTGQLTPNGFTLGSFSTARYDDSLPHHVVVTDDGATRTYYIDGVSQGSDGQISLPSTGVVRLGSNFQSISLQTAYGSNAYFNGALAEVAVYGVVLSASQVLAHYTAGSSGGVETTGVRVGRVLDYVGWSTSARSIDTGSTTVMAHDLSGGSALDYTNTLSKSENGGWYVNQSGQMKWRQRAALITQTRFTTSNATFGDTAGQLQYFDYVSQYDRTEIYNDVRTTRSGGVTQVAQDTASQASYLRRTLDQSGLYMSNDNEALANAQWNLSRSKNPLYRVQKITIQPQSDPTNLWPQSLGRELEDRVTVNRTPVNLGSAISKQVYVESIAHRIQPDLWETDFELAPALDVDNWWVWNTSTWGNTTGSKWAY